MNVNLNIVSYGRYIMHTVLNKQAQKIYRHTSTAAAVLQTVYHA